MRPVLLGPNFIYFMSTYSSIVATFNQEKALSVITKLRVDLRLQLYS